MFRSLSASFLSRLLVAGVWLALTGCGKKTTPPPAAPTCAVAHGGCDLNASCAESSGQITCTCRAGYTGDGKSCAATGPQLVSGEAHTCGLWADGTLRCWGSNESGQLGDGTFDSSDVPVTIGQPEWKSVAAGARHTVGVKNDGTLWWWGWDYQVGLTPRRVQKKPTRMALDSDWVNVVSSTWQICGLKQSGSVWCRPSWGGYPAPLKVMAGPENALYDVDVSFRSLEAGPWRSLALGDHHLCAVKTDGTVWCWGVEKDESDLYSHVLPGPVQLNAETDWSTVAAGSSSTCAIKTNGTLWCWSHSSLCFPCFNGGPTQVGSGTDWTSLTVADGHMCATRLDGTLLCRGDNDYGQIGTGTTTAAADFTPVSSDAKWITASAGTWQTCAVQTDQSVWCWGREDGGPNIIERDGNTKTTPVKTNALSREQVSVATGDTHSCSIDSNAQLTCWGVSGPTDSCGSSGCERMPRTFAGDWTSVTAGFTFSCGVQSSGDGLCWGNNDDGELGNGTTDPSADPVTIPGGTKWRMLSTRDRHICGISTSDELWCWGANEQGQLGTGEDEGTITPVKIPSALGWTTVSASYTHTCGIQTDGSLWCWGENTNGELGDDTIVTRDTPVQVGTDTTWSQVSTGMSHTCAMKQDQSLWCWGDNASGELGVGSLEGELHTPQPINTILPWATFATGDRITCGVKIDGSLWCWGTTDTGLLGTQVSGEQLTPAQMGTDTDWSTLSLSIGHACGVRSGTTWCWGSNRVNELGDAVEWGLVPVQLPVK